jgi:hypothetical protein
MPTQWAALGPAAVATAAAASLPRSLGSLGSFGSFPSLLALPQYTSVTAQFAPPHSLTHEVIADLMADGASGSPIPTAAPTMPAVPTARSGLLALLPYPRSTAREVSGSAEASSAADRLSPISPSASPPAADTVAGATAPVTAFSSFLVGGDGPVTLPATEQAARSPVTDARASASRAAAAAAALVAAAASAAAGARRRAITVDESLLHGGHGNSGAAPSDIWVAFELDRET